MLAGGAACLHALFQKRMNMLWFVETEDLTMSPLQERTMSKSKRNPVARINPVRQLLARLLFLVIVLGAAALFGSLLEVTCHRNGTRVHCAIERGVEVPWGQRAWIPFWKQRVENLREITVERQGTSRSQGTPSQSRDVLVWRGDQRLEAGWTGAWSPVRSFLRSTTRTDLTVRQPLDPRAKLVSNSLLLLAALAVLDAFLVLALGNRRIRAWLGPAPDPDAPLPTTGLAKVGPILSMMGVLAVVAFFAVGYRFVGPLAEHKVAALHTAAAQGDLGGLERALAAGVAVDAEDGGRTALFLGARHPGLLDHLLARGADPNVVGLSGETPLHSAASYNSKGGVTTLLAHGAHPDPMDDSGWTPLRRAAAAGNVEAVRALLAAGADPKRQGPRGWTSLHSAAGANHLGIVRTLLVAGADPNVRNERGHRPGDLARDAEIKELLLATEPEAGS